MLVNTYTVRNKIAGLISKRKRIPAGRVLRTSFTQLGFDALDLVEVILEVEKAFKVVIPDEVPLNTVNDFTDFICGSKLQQAS